MKSLILGALFLYVAAQEVEETPKAVRRLVCYYGSWAVYRPGDGKFDVEDIDPFLCTHIMFGFAALDASTNNIVAFDPWNDLTDGGGKGAYERFVGLKRINPNLKAMLAVGGWNEGSTKYSRMAATAASRSAFVRSVVPFVKKFGFDGLDMDWEYPAQRGGVAEDRANFIALLQELRTAFNREGLLLSAAVSPSDQVCEEAYDIPVVNGLLDFINLMAYDYHGAWEGVTGHNAPLYAHPLDDGNSTNFNVDFTVRYWIENGATPSKINLGMPLYGRGWLLDNEMDNGPYAPASNPLPQAQYTRQVGIWGYNELCETMLAEPGEWSLIFNEYYQAPYAVSGKRWLSFDNKQSLSKKMELVDKYGLGGAMIWSIETDDFRRKCNTGPFPLLTHIKKALAGEIVTSAPQQTTTTPRPTTTTSTTTTPRPTTTAFAAPTTASTTTRPASTSTTTTGGLNGTCSREGYFILDCDTYYYCQWDPATSKWVIQYFQCPAGTAPNIQNATCDWEENVAGCNGTA